MARIVFVHGIGQQSSSGEEQERLWLPSLVKGVLSSGHPHAGAVAAELAASLEPGAEPVGRMAFYGDLFLPTDVQGGEIPASSEAEDLAEELAVALLQTAEARGEQRSAAEAGQALHQLALQTADPGDSQVQGRGAVTRSAVAMLDNNRWLAARIFGLAQRASPNLTQVARYLAEPELHDRIQATVGAVLGEDTVLVIGHSLGSVVAWEAYQQLTRPLPMLVTIGSPLGLDTVVYPRLRPQPPGWPDAVTRWVNVAHRDDFIAVEPLLASLFPATDGRKVVDHTTVSKNEHHGAAGYLEEPATGDAIVDALHTG